MADRYHDRPFASDADYDRVANPNAPAKGDSDPLAELARLIGQNDPFGAAAKPPLPLQSRANVRPQYDAVDEEEAVAPAGPPPWMQRARHEAPPQQEYDEPEPEYQPSPVHPLHRYAAQQPVAHERDDHEPTQYSDEQPVDPSRYDDALYGQLESGQQEYARDPAFPDDPYAYQSDYEEEPEPRKRSNGLVTVVAVLALAVVGTGAAFGYRTYVGSPRVGEPPIIKADNSPTKVMAAPSDGGVTAKTPDRLVPGDGGEKIVSREETPVDVTSKSGPRVVFPPLNPNGNPPSVSSVSPAAPPPATAASGALPNNEPRKIKTLAVKGDADNGGVPAGVAAAKPAPAATRSVAPAPAPAPAAPRNPSSANASATGPLSLAPQQGGGTAPDPAPTRIAAANPVQTAPSTNGGFMVQVSSQKNEADAQASFRMLQGKYPAVLGSRSASIRRADLGDKGVVYRSMVGPFGSQDEATQFCGNLKTAGGQCVILRN
jgi:hypothetical protein